MMADVLQITHLPEEDQKPSLPFVPHPDILEVTVLFLGHLLHKCKSDKPEK